MPWYFNIFTSNLDYYQAGGSSDPDTTGDMLLESAFAILLEDNTSTLALEA